MIRDEVLGDVILFPFGVALHRPEVERALHDAFFAGLAMEHHILAFHAGAAINTGPWKFVDDLLPVKVSNRLIAVRDAAHRALVAALLDFDEALGANDVAVDALRQVRRGRIR